MTWQGTVKASFLGGVDAYLLAQQLDGHLALVDSLRTAARVRLAAILSADEALWDLGTFAFAASHLFSTIGRHSYSVAELLHLIIRTEELHTEVQGMIPSPHLATPLLFDVSRQWSLYLNRCVAASASESLDAPGCQVYFSLEPILAYLEGGKCVGPIIPTALGDLVSRSSGRGSGGGGGSGGDIGATSEKRKYLTTEGDTRVQVR